MKTIITLTLLKALSEAEKNMLQILLADALYEFQTARLPAEDYVEKRYAYLSEAERAREVEQVNARVTLAEKLHEAALQATMEGEAEKYRCSHSSADFYNGVCSRCGNTNPTSPDGGPPRLGLSAPKFPKEK